MTPSYKKVTKEKVTNFAKAASSVRLAQALENIYVHMWNTSGSIKNLEKEIQWLEELHKGHLEEHPDDLRLIKSDKKTLTTIKADYKRMEMSNRIIQGEIKRRDKARCKMAAAPAAAQAPAQ